MQGSGRVPGFLVRGLAALGTTEEMFRNPSPWHPREMEAVKQRNVAWEGYQSKAECIWAEENSEAPPTAFDSASSLGSVLYRDHQPREQRK